MSRKLTTALTMILAHILPVGRVKGACVLPDNFLGAIKLYASLLWYSRRAVKFRREYQLALVQHIT